MESKWIKGDPWPSDADIKKAESQKRLSRDGRFLGYQVQVLLPNGQRKTLGTTKTRREAVQLAQKGAVDLLAGRLAASPRQTLDAYLADWLEAKRPRIRYKTYVTYRTVIGHACTRIGRMRLHAIRPAHIQQCEQDLRRTTGPRTVQQMYTVLSQAFRRAVQLDLIARNPTEAVEPPRTPRIERPSLTIKQAGAFLTATRSDRLYAPLVRLNDNWSATRRGIGIAGGRRRLKRTNPLGSKIASTANREGLWAGGT